MANGHRTVTLSGKISERAKTFSGNSKRDDSPYTRTSFELTEPKVIRKRESDGVEYEASDAWKLSVMNADDVTKAQLADLEIGDDVEVEVSLTPRKGYPNFNVISVRNSAQ